MKAKMLWILLILLGILTSISILMDGVGLDIRSNTFLFSIILLFPLLLLLLHSLWIMTFPRAIFFIGLAFTLGLLSEIAGMQYGVLFGGNYVYKQSALSLFEIPLIIPLYWALFIYTGYTITNSFLIWIKKERPSVRNKRFFLLPLLIILDGLLVVGIDLFMDPIEVQKGSWTWLTQGPYFGIPIGNFIGWFLVTVVTTSIYRTFEYLRPSLAKIDKNVFVIPVIGYGMLFVTFFSSALRLQLPELALL